MPAPVARVLSPRESQILEVIHHLGEATAAEVMERMPDPPGYSSVRKHLSILEEKGFVQHRQDGPRYVYSAATPPERAGSSALRQVVRAFFGGSREQALSAFLGLSSAAPTSEEIRVLEAYIDRAREQEE